MSGDNFSWRDIVMTGAGWLVTALHMGSLVFIVAFILSGRAVWVMFKEWERDSVTSAHDRQR